MTLTLADVHRIAHLARIEIDAAARDEVHTKLEAIFAMINELQAVDTTGIVPMSHAQERDAAVARATSSPKPTSAQLYPEVSRRPSRTVCTLCRG